MADKLSEEVKQLLIAQAAILDNIVQENSKNPKLKVNARLAPYNPTEKAISQAEQKKINTIKKLYGF